MSSKTIKETEKVPADAIGYHIVVDALGSDGGSGVVEDAVKMALLEFPDIKITVVGCKGKGTDRVSFVEADEFNIHDNPKLILKEKKDTSMGKALMMLKEDKADALVSGGSTAALAMGATMLVGRIKGVKRPALAPVMPGADGPYMLIDVGANSECRPSMLVQFAVMGSIYINSILGVENPKVGLVNIGAEDTKGTALQLESYPMLSEQEGINFAGNIEARELPFSACHVAVCDGWTGNIILKTQEGMGKYFNSFLKGTFVKTKGKLSALLVMDKLKAFKKKMDYTEYGGAPLMGIAKPVIKAHGSSNPKAFYNAIRQARNFIKADVISKIENEFINK